MMPLSRLRSVGSGRRCCSKGYANIAGILACAWLTLLAVRVVMSKQKGAIAEFW
jgi:hypothetical protein